MSASVKDGARHLKSLKDGRTVYIDGKLVGAVSYSFPFSKEPICGITPIEQMISIFEQAPSSKLANASPRVFTSTELLATTWRHASGHKLSGSRDADSESRW